MCFIYFNTTYISYLILPVVAEVNRNEIYSLVMEVFSTTIVIFLWFCLYLNEKGKLKLDEIKLAWIYRVSSVGHTQ